MTTKELIATLRALYSQPAGDRRRLFSNRVVLEHKPIERSIERIDGGFVLVGGWQTQYGPGIGHRRWVLSKEYHEGISYEAAVRQKKRREEAELARSSSA